jgi:hypothetical protein
MSLLESDISQIETIISEQLGKALDSFLKESVAPMVSGATKRALSEAPQVTEAQLKEQLEAFRASIADPSDLVNHAVSQVLERLSTVDDDQYPGDNTVDVDAISAAIQAKLGKELENERKLLESERKARAEAERQHKLVTRDRGFVEALIKSGKVAPDMADVALDIALKKGYILPSEDESSFEVEEPDRFGLGTERKPALEKLEDILNRPEMQYFRPARAGTGTGSTPGQRVNQGMGAGFQVLSSTDPEDIKAEDLLRAYESGNGDKVFADLRLLQSS